MAISKNFTFDGGAATYWGTLLAAILITIFTLFIGLPWALCLKQKWICKHTYINGKRLKFIGSGGSLIGLWIKIWFLSIITLGIYQIWAAPALQKWIVEHTEFEDN